MKAARVAAQGEDAMQSVLILGAGLLQRPAILAAKRLGYRAVVVDGNAQAVCVPLADEFHRIDLKDKEGIFALARNIAGLDAVFTAGTDFSASVAYVTERLGLPGHSYEAAMNASDKGRMRECFRRSGVPSPRFRVIGGSQFTSEPSNANHSAVEQSSQGIETTAWEKAIEDIGYPCVIKPVDNMGARGCRMVRTPDEALESIRGALLASRTGRAIVEKYMDGPEYSIDALVFDGEYSHSEVTITGFADRHIYWPPYFIETGHTMPTAVDEEKRIALIETFARGIAALGLTHGAAKADIKWTRDGPMVGEIAARLSGGYMSGWTYPYASGLDLTEQALLVAAGRRPEALLKGRIPINEEATPFALYDYLCTAVCAERAWVSIPGRVAEVVGVEKLAGVKDVFPRASAGDEVDFPVNNVQKCGNVIAVAPTREEAVQAAENAAASVVLVLEPHNSKTDSFLSERTDFPPSAFQVSGAIWDEVAHMEGVLRPGDKAAECIPPVVKYFLEHSDKKCIENASAATHADMNRRTLKDTLVLFDKLCKGRTCDVPLSVFWGAVLRGGLQGALYSVMGRK